MVETYIQFAESCATYWYDGKIPQDRASFIERMLNLWLPHTCALDAETWLRERERVAEHLAVALDYLTCERAGRWTN